MTNLPPGVSPSSLDRAQREWEEQCEQLIDWLAQTGLEVHQALEAIRDWARYRNIRLPQDTDQLLEGLQPPEWQEP